MAHFFAPQPSKPDLPTFFNVDGAVGAAPAQNLRDDVLLVQFMLKYVGDAASAEGAAALRAVEVTGIMDDKTIHAIRVFQEAIRKTQPGTVVDGRVSPAKGYSYGGGMWSIAYLNDQVQERNLEIWPRIDKLPGCHPDIAQMVRRQLVGLR